MSIRMRKKLTRSLAAILVSFHNSVATTVCPSKVHTSWSSCTQRINRTSSSTCDLYRTWNHQGKCISVALKIKKIWDNPAKSCYIVSLFKHFCGLEVNSLKRHIFCKFLVFMVKKMNIQISCFPCAIGTLSRDSDFFKGYKILSFKRSCQLPLVDGSTVQGHRRRNAEGSTAETVTEVFLPNHLFPQYHPYLLVSPSNWIWMDN